VHQRWGAAPWEDATHYVGRRFSIGSAGANYGPMDKPLTVNLAGGPRMPMAYFAMDARADPYGKKRVVTGGGHHKAFHLQPFLASVQRGPEVLLLASADPAGRWFRRRAPEPTCLASHVVLPTEATVWVGNSPADPAAPTVPVPQGAPVFLRLGDVAVGIRILLATGAGGRPAAVSVVNDGTKYRVRRLTCLHSPSVPTRRATVGLWVRGAEGLDEAAFAQFRTSFAGADARTEGDVVELSAPGLQGALRVAANVATGERTTREGAAPDSQDDLLVLDGEDLGRAILSRVGPIPHYRRLLAAAERGGRAAATAGQTIEAETGLLVPPFEIGADAAAGGGRFLWMPGEPGAGGGSPIARALWVVRVPKAGDYVLWGRVAAPTPDDDSFFARIRQGTADALPLTAWHTGTHGEWTWTALMGPDRAPLPIALRAGTAVVELRCREDGTRLDALALRRSGSGPPP
jgi:hypothetical protein